MVTDSETRASCFGPLDGRRETFAIALAKGHSVRACIRAAGVAKDTGYRWAKEPEVLARAEQLRNADHRLPSADELLKLIVRTSEAACEGGAYKAAIEGYRFAHQVVAERERHEGIGASAGGVGTMEMSEIQDYLSSGAGALSKGDGFN